MYMLVNMYIDMLDMQINETGQYQLLVWCILIGSPVGDMHVSAGLS